MAGGKEVALNRRRAIRLSLIFLAAAVGAALVLGSPVLLLAAHRGLSIDDLTKMGLLGEAYGGISALVSAAAIAGVVATLSVQIRQVKISQAQAMTAGARRGITEGGVRRSPYARNVGRAREVAAVAQVVIVWFGSTALIDSAAGARISNSSRIADTIAPRGVADGVGGRRGRARDCAAVEVRR
ncbi:hypothetical protein GCM10023170_083580 [Phytohabitans houttuyneae]